MALTALVVATVGLLFALAGALGAFLAYRGLGERIESTPSWVESQYDDSPLKRQLADLTQAVAEGIERVDRAERRVKATVRSAKKELADAGFQHPGLNAEDAQLQLVDDIGVDPGPLPGLPDVLEDAPDPLRPGPFPGSTMADVEAWRNEEAG